MFVIVTLMFSAHHRVELVQPQQRLLQIEVNHWLTGKNAFPLEQQVASYTVSGQYVLVNWHQSDGGGQLVLHYDGANYAFVYGSGGQLAASDLIPYAVPSADAEALTSASTFTFLTP